MKTRELVNNFVKQFNKPFDAQTVADMTECPLRGVKAVLAELLAAGQIKLIDAKQKIYVRDHRFATKIRYNTKGGWSFDTGDALKLLELIEQGEFCSIRKIANAAGRSRQWVYVYLEALASIDCIALTKKRYVVISRARVKEIGRHIIPGILGRMRTQCGEEAKAQAAQEKEQKRLARQIRQAEKERLAQQKLASQEEDRRKQEAEQAQREAFLNEWQAYLNSGLAAALSFEQFLRNRMNS